MQRFSFRKGGVIPIVIEDMIKAPASLVHGKLFFEVFKGRKVCFGKKNEKTQKSDSTNNGSTSLYWC